MNMPVRTRSEGETGWGGIAMAVRQPEVSVNVQVSEQILLPGKTYEEYLVAVEHYSNLRVEYLGGAIIMSPSPVPLHQRISGNLFMLLNSYVKTRRLGEIFYAPLDVELSPEAHIAQPDLIFVAQDRVAELVGEKRILGAPDLLIEILSPSSARTDRMVKLPIYANFGVAEYWIVNQQEPAIEVYILDGETYRVAGLFQSGDTITAGRFAEAQIVVDQIFEI
jgi:Uma2 family endonuclease